MLIGIDFDNTIAGYDALFARIAIEGGWVEAGFAGSKKALRERIYALPDGLRLWIGMQAKAYGARMAEASLIEGVAPFLRQCRARGHRLMIVSHKTQYAAADPGGTDMRQAALGWMARQGFFDPAGFAFSRGDVHFTDSRSEKCDRIAGLGCDLFIDDLEEVFLDPAFPSATARFLFHPGAATAPAGPFRAFSDWRSLGDAVLAACEAHQTRVLPSPSPEGPQQPQTA